MFQPGVVRLKTFDTRMRNEVCLWYQGGCVYHILDDDKTILSEHVRFDEFVLQVEIYAV